MSRFNRQKIASLMDDSPAEVLGGGFCNVARPLIGTGGVGLSLLPVPAGSALQSRG